MFNILRKSHKNYYYNRLIYKLLLMIIAFLFLSKSICFGYENRDAVELKFDAAWNLQMQFNKNYGYAPRAFVLYDIDSEECLVSYNVHKELGIASISKLMTAYILFEAIENGETSFDDRVDISDFAVSQYGDEGRLRTGMNFSVRELANALLICSSNDAAVAIAEHIAGTEQEFVQIMNSKLDELGLEGKFTNASGLTNEGENGEALADQNIMDAKSIAKLAMSIIKK